MQAFQFIKANHFFPQYAPGVRNWRHKCRGKDARNNPLNFTKQDISIIDKGIWNMCRELFPHVDQVTAY